MSSLTLSLKAQRLLFDFFPEILGEIFLACIADTENEAHYSLSCAPINISQVCQKWRQVALSTPRLWSSFTLVQHYVESDRSESYHNVKRIIPVIKNWIKRSSFAPLEFIINIRLNESTMELATEVESLLQILIGHQARWKFVTIIYDSPLSRWFDVTLSNMPMLKHLQLECCSAPDCFVRLDLTQSRGLQTLFLQGNIKMIGSGPLPNLLGAHVLPSGLPSSTFPTLHDCFEILRKAPSLEILDATCQGSESENSFEHITMDKLHSIRLRLGRTFITSKEHFSKIFEYLTLPSLDALHISCHSVVDDTPVEAQLLGMVQRSRAPITLLTLSSSAVNQEHLISLLRLLPSLKKLYLNEMRSVDSVLASLTLTGVSEASEDICPGLETISVRAVDSLTLPLLSDCIISRWRGPGSTKEDRASFGRSLKEISVMYCIVRGVLSEEVYEFTKEGLSVEFIDARS